MYYRISRYLLINLLELSVNLKWDYANSIIFKPPYSTYTLITPASFSIPNRAALKSSLGILTVYANRTNSSRQFSTNNLFGYADGSNAFTGLNAL